MLHQQFLLFLFSIPELSELFSKQAHISIIETINKSWNSNNNTTQSVKYQRQNNKKKKKNQKYLEEIFLEVQHK